MFVALALSALEKLSQNPELLKKFSLPNINFPTMGGEVMWNNIAKYNGWRVQQNTITHHCRILDPNNLCFLQILVRPNQQLYQASEIRDKQVEL